MCPSKFGGPGSKAQISQPFSKSLLDFSVLAWIAPEPCLGLTLRSNILSYTLKNWYNPPFSPTACHRLLFFGVRLQMQSPLLTDPYRYSLQMKSLILKPDVFIVENQVGRQKSSAGISLSWGGNGRKKKIGKGAISFTLPELSRLNYDQWGWPGLSAKTKHISQGQPAKTINSAKN